MDSREMARRELLQAFVALGYPMEFGEVVAGQLRGEKSMARMAAYLRKARPSSMEDIADEMLAIVSERESWVEKKVAERANAKITEYYNSDLRDPDGD